MFQLFLTALFTSWMTKEGCVFKLTLKLLKSSKHIFQCYINDKPNYDFKIDAFFFNCNANKYFMELEHRNEYFKKFTLF